MKGLSAFSLLIAISAAANAFGSHWVLDRSKTGGLYWLYDLLIAAGFVVLSIILWSVANARAYAEELARDQELAYPKEHSRPQKRRSRGRRWRDEF